MDCRKCDEPALDNGSGLCEVHFEAQRSEIRASLAANGEIPVIKSAPRAKPFNAKPGASTASAATWLGRVAVVAFFVVLFSYYLKDDESLPSTFKEAKPGQIWLIHSPDIVVLRFPEVPVSAEAMLGAAVAVVSPGDTFIILERRPDRWIRGDLVSPGKPVRSGWVLGDTVASARLVR